MAARGVIKDNSNTTDGNFYRLIDFIIGVNDTSRKAIRSEKALSSRCEIKTVLDFSQKV
jgi:hypothetical protein